MTGFYTVLLNRNKVNISNLPSSTQDFVELFKSFDILFHDGCPKSCALKNAIISCYNSITKTKKKKKQQKPHSPE